MTMKVVLCLCVMLSFSLDVIQAKMTAHTVIVSFSIASLPWSAYTADISSSPLLTESFYTEILPTTKGLTVDLQNVETTITVQETPVTITEHPFLTDSVYSELLSTSKEFNNNVQNVSSTSYYQEGSLTHTEHPFLTEGFYTEILPTTKVVTGDVHNGGTTSAGQTGSLSPIEHSLLTESFYTEILTTSKGFIENMPKVDTTSIKQGTHAKSTEHPLLTESIYTEILSTNKEFTENIHNIGSTTPGQDKLVTSTENSLLTNRMYTEILSTYTGFIDNVTNVATDLEQSESTTIQTQTVTLSPHLVSGSSLSPPSDLFTDSQPVTDYYIFPLQTRIATTREQINHPVEDAFLVEAPKFSTEEYFTDYDTFTIKDGKLFRVLSDITVYGNTKYVLASWRFIGPILLTVLLISTILFCCLITYRHNKGSEMNKCSTMLLVYIGLFDILTIASAMAENIYLYNKTKGNYEILPFESCHTMYILERLPPIPHTISLWLTVVLSLQRCICISKPFDAKTEITIKKTLLYIVLVIVIATGFHIPRFFDLGFQFAALTSKDRPSQVIETCGIFYKTWIRNSRMYEAAYLWTRFVIVKLVPCVLMTIFSFAIIRSLGRNLAGRYDGSQSKASTFSNRLSFYIAVISAIIVLAELPIGVVSCIYALSISLKTTVIAFTTLKRVSFIADIVLYISYCIIFLLYCIITKRVRSFISNCVSRTFKRSTLHISDQKVSKSHVLAMGQVSTGSSQSSNSFTSLTTSEEQGIFSTEML